MKLGIIGSGSWGTALANTFTFNRNVFDVVIFCRSNFILNDINHNNKNTKYLGNTHLGNIRAVNSLKEVLSCGVIIIAIPSLFIEDFLKNERDFFLKIPHKSHIIIATKGFIEIKNELVTIKEEIERINNNIEISYMSGPSLAHDLVLKKRTYVNIACKTKRIFNKLNQYIATDFFIISYVKDFLGMQASGVIKNIVAIACGIAEELGLGSNFIAYIVNTGYIEMIEFSEIVGGKEATTRNFCGIGDLMLTCYSNKSKNRTFGRYMVNKEVLINVKPEGYFNSKLVFNLLKSKRKHLKLCFFVYEVIYNNRSVTDILCI